MNLSWTKPRDFIFRLEVVCSRRRSVHFMDFTFGWGGGRRRSYYFSAFAGAVAAASASSQCVPEERWAPHVGSNDLFYLPPPTASLCSCSWSRWSLSPLHHSTVSLCLFLFFKSSFPCYIHHSRAHTHTHREKKTKNWHTSEHKRQACSTCVCVCVRMLINLSCFFSSFFFFFSFPMRLLWIRLHSQPALPQKLGNSRGMERRTMKACLETMGRCAGSGPVWLSPRM